MTRTPMSADTTFGGLAAIAVTATVFANTALGSAPAALATCASFFGIGNGHSCTSTSGSVAIGDRAGRQGHCHRSRCRGSFAGVRHNVQALAGTDTLGPVAEFKNPVGNLAIDIATNPGNIGSIAAAIGYVNLAFNLGSGFATAAQAIGSLSTGVNLFGTRSVAEAGPGPFAVAGSLFQTGTTVKKSGPGLNINGLARTASRLLRDPPSASTRGR
jgi:hypothetical protein